MTASEGMGRDLAEMAARVGALLKERDESVAVAESSAGGLVSAALLAVPGASAYYAGGAVVYTTAARRELLGMADHTLVGIRSSSEPYAERLAQTVQARFRTTWGLAETGAAGPTGNRYGDKAGHTCLAVCGPVSRVTTLETAQGDRVDNMWRFAQAALDLLAEALAAAPPPAD